MKKKELLDFQDMVVKIETRFSGEIAEDIMRAPISADGDASIFFSQGRFARIFDAHGAITTAISYPSLL